MTSLSQSEIYGHVHMNPKEIYVELKPFFLFFSGYCHSSSVSASLENLCMSIESDSPLFFIFRTTSRDKNVLLQKDTEACPFRNIEYAFSYSTRGGAKVQVEINYEGAVLLLCAYNFTRFLSVIYVTIHSEPKK